MALVRRIMDDAGVSFQTAEPGKVDVGGGGTIAYIPAKYGMDVTDSGAPVLSMHSPWEVTSKADIYEARRGYEAFLRDASQALRPTPHAPFPTRKTKARSFLAAGLPLRTSENSEPRMGITPTPWAPAA